MLRGIFVCFLWYGIWTFSTYKHMNFGDEFNKIKKSRNRNWYCVFMCLHARAFTFTFALCVNGNGTGFLFCLKTKLNLIWMASKLERNKQWELISCILSSNQLINSGNTRGMDTKRERPQWMTKIVAHLNKHTATYIRLHSVRFSSNAVPFGLIYFIRECACACVCVCKSLNEIVSRIAFFPSISICLSLFVSLFHSIKWLSLLWISSWFAIFIEHLEYVAMKVPSGDCDLSQPSESFFSPSLSLSRSLHTTFCVLSIFVLSVGSAVSAI